MKKLMIVLNAVLFLTFLSVFVSCAKADPVGPEDSGLDPFANGSNERNMIVVISDIHLGADLNYAECNANLGALEKMLGKIRAAKNVKELVIAGDLLDEWFVPATINTYQGKDQTDFVQRIGQTNKGVFDVINGIIQDGNILVTYVPGNHDLTITAENVDLILPGIHQVRDNEQGLGTYSPADFPVLAIEHSHRYNFFCAPDISNKDIAPRSIMPPGYFFTRIAALHAVQKALNNGVNPIPGDSTPIVTENLSGDESQNMAFLYWNVWKGLMTELPVKDKFSDKIIVTNIDGFTENYSINDLMPYQLTPGGFIDMNIYKGVQDNWKEREMRNHVQVDIPVEEAIMYAASASESDKQAEVQYFMNSNSDKRIVVFGHTHDTKIIPSQNYKGQKAIYANSGTWIDHNNVAATTMNFVVITPQNSDASSQTYVKLYNYEGEVVTKMAEESLRY